MKPDRNVTDSPPRTGSRSTVKNLYKKRLASAAGGIGITPFMSMLRQAAHDHLARRLVLLYSNRRPEDAAFLAELIALEGRLESFRLRATMTAMRQSSQTWGAGSHAADAKESLIYPGQAGWRRECDEMKIEA